MATKAPVEKKPVVDATISDKAFVMADKAAASAEAAYAAASEKVVEVATPALKAAQKTAEAAAKTIVKATKPVAKKVVVKKPVAKKPAAKKVVAKVAVKKSPIVKAVKAIAAKAPVKTPIHTSVKGTKSMTDTVKNYADAAKAQFEAMFGDNFADFGTKAKDMMAQGQKVAAEVVEFSKGNLEAVVESSKITAKGAQVIAKDSFDYGRKSVEDTTAAFKSLTAVKSPTEFMTLNTELSKKAFDSAVAQASKQSELMLKLANDAFAPISGRFSVAMTKFKNAA
jgi:phasin family protein